jgi:hypothetical protein
MTGADDGVLPGPAAIIGAMAVLNRICASLLALTVIAGCGSEELASPAGRWTTTITTADEPPSDRLVDAYRLEIRTDGGYVLEGAGFTASGSYVVDGDELRLRDDDRCAPGTTGRYTWRRGDGGALTFTAVEQDPCDLPLGGREFVLTRHPWSPAAG